MRSLVGSGVAVVLWATALVAGAHAEAGDLAVAYSRETGDRAEIESALGRWGWEVTEAPPFHDGGRILVLDARPRPDAAIVTDLFAAAERLRSIPGVLGAGERIPDSDDRRRIYSGFALVEPEDGARIDEIVLWAGRHGFGIETGRVGDDSVLLDTSATLFELLAAVGDLPSTVRDVRPIDFDIPTRPPQEPTFSAGGFHPIPRNRNELAVVYFAGADIAAVEAELASLPGFGFISTVRGVRFYRFGTEQDLDDAQQSLAGRSEVALSGPAISHDPPRFLSDRLIVKFVDEYSWLSSTVEVAAAGLTEVRPLTQIRNGVLYRYSDASYRLYDIARSLLASGRAEYAAPDTIVEARAACDPGDCTITNQTYLEPVFAPGAWKIAEPYERATSIGILDSGLLKPDGSDQCGEFSVSALLDASVLGASTRVSCGVESVTEWCTECEAAGIGTTETHTQSMATVASARHSASTGACDEPRGLSDRPPLIVVQRRPSDSLLDGDPDVTAESLFTSTLVWMAGADPGDPSFPVALTEDRRASVLNLSFHMEYRAEGACTETVESSCEAVCTEADDVCSIVEETLANLREGAIGGVRPGGVLIVAARAHSDDASDLDRSPSVVTAGSVEMGGSPRIGAGSTWLHTPAWRLDIVVPMGAQGTKVANGWATTGHSSAATAAVSGVAAMMFDVNTDMTADLAHCILRETAQRLSDDGSWWDDDHVTSWTFATDGTTEECELDLDCNVPAGGCPDDHCTWTDTCRFEPKRGGPSPCFGHGLVDACAAVSAAEACTTPTFVFDLPDKTTATVSPALPVVGGVRRTDTKEWTAVASLATSASCPCNADGTPKTTPMTPIAILKEPFRPPAPTDVEEVPNPVIRLLQCVLSGDCECRLPTDCLIVDVINPHEIDWNDIRMQVCIRNRCWEIPRRWDVWESGQTIAVPIPLEREIVSWWRATGEPLRFRAYSAGRAIDLRSGRVLPATGMQRPKVK